MKSIAQFFKRMSPQKKKRGRKKKIFTGQLVDVSDTKPDGGVSATSHSDCPPVSSSSSSAVSSAATENTAATCSPPSSPKCDPPAIATNAENHRAKASSTGAEDLSPRASEDASLEVQPLDFPDAQPMLDGKVQGTAEVVANADVSQESYAQQPSKVHMAKAKSSKTGVSGASKRGLSKGPRKGVPKTMVNSRPAEKRSYDPQKHRQPGVKYPANLKKATDSHPWLFHECLEVKGGDRKVPPTNVFTMSTAMRSSRRAQGRHAHRVNVLSYVVVCNDFCVHFYHVYVVCSYGFFFIFSFLSTLGSYS